MLCGRTKAALPGRLFSRMGASAFPSLVYKIEQGLWFVSPHADPYPAGVNASALHLTVCRPEFEGSLVAELKDRGIPARRISAGLVGSEVDLPASPLIFERQRLPQARMVPMEQLKPIADATVADIVAPLLAKPVRWTTQSFAIDDLLQGRAQGIEQTLLRLIAKKYPQLDDLYRAPHRMDKIPDIHVLQCCLTPEGLWHSLTPVTALSSREPGGVVRMKFDDAAPSRSYLKIEEAFQRMGEWPAEGQKVIDLGAAPGGWTWACCKRGCSVLAVDNGPMKIPEGAGPVRHMRVNGITFEPPRDWVPVDWLVADMLIAPGVALGLLRRWVDAKWMHRFVVNIKLPQDEAFTALKPIATYLDQQASAGVTAEIRQLYHDRREVTVMGRRRAS